MKMLRFIGWVVIFLVVYVGFLILFQYGPLDFMEGAKREAARFQELLISQS